MQQYLESEYNRDQSITFRAVLEACERLQDSEIERLKESILPYLTFRDEMDRYQSKYVEDFCRESCFDSGLSACCGFESIITFFADHVISFLFSKVEEMRTIFSTLERPNRTGKCVYLGKGGCIWKIRPISCAMFFCRQVKAGIVDNDPEAAAILTEFKSREKEYTWPTRPVLFNDLEKYFIELGVKSPHMHFHQSPGLLRLKAESVVA